MKNKARTCHLGGCVLFVDPNDGYTRVEWTDDGAYVEARPHLRGVSWCSEEQADAYEATATLLGYPPDRDGLVRMNLEHDPLHVWASVVLLKRDDSPTLRGIATGKPIHPTKHGDAVGFEERLVQALALWLNTGQETEPLSLLWWRGHLPPLVEREAHRFLDGLGWLPT